MCPSSGAFIRVGVPCELQKEKSRPFLHGLEGKKTLAINNTSFQETQEPNIWLDTFIQLLAKASKGHPCRLTQ